MTIYTDKIRAAIRVIVKHRVDLLNHYDANPAKYWYYDDNALMSGIYYPVTAKTITNDIVITPIRLWLDAQHGPQE